MRKVVLCIAGTLTINCGPKVDGDRDSRSGTRIGPSGGVVEGPNGARIEIPAGALSEEVAIGIRLANSADLEGINWSALETTVDDRFVNAEVSSFSFFQPGASAPEEDDGVEEAGEAYEVTPHGQGFMRPVRVRIPYRSRVEGLGLFRGAGGEAETKEYACTDYPTSFYDGSNYWYEDFDDGTYQGRCDNQGCRVEDGELISPMGAAYRVHLCCHNSTSITTQWDWKIQWDGNAESINPEAASLDLGDRGITWVVSDNWDIDDNTGEYFAPGGGRIVFDVDCDPSPGTPDWTEYIRIDKNKWDRTGTARIEVQQSQYRLFHDRQLLVEGTFCPDDVSFSSSRHFYSFGDGRDYLFSLDNLIIECG